MKEKLCYVRSVLTKEISILCNDHEQLKFLRLIGAKRRYFISSEWVLKYSSDEDLTDLFRKLRDNGFLFSYDQHGWGPSDVFRHHRDKGLLTGKFKEIFWRGGGKYRITDE